MKHDVEVDVWLNFGSFLYGFTADISGFNAQKMSLKLVLKSIQSSAAKPIDSTSEWNETKNFIEVLKSKSSSLIYTEVRIFLTSHRPERMIRLNSMLCPTIDSGNTDFPEVSLHGLNPSTAHDFVMWKELTEKIWPLQTE
jgi:hypothetical protein